jgi:nicotinate-nucleotide adenylyltransferase
MRRAILGGTFDPPHLAHCFAGEAAFRQLGVDVVTFLPAGAPWQKADRSVTAAHHRWAMTEASVVGVDYFEADRREVDRDGWTFTADTLESFQGDDLVLVLGSDAAAGLSSWRRPDDVLELARIAVMPRAGATIDDVLRAVPAHRLSVLDTPELRLSGTELRRRAADGHSLRFLVREPVWHYIEREDLYRAGRRDPT